MRIVIGAAAGNVGHRVAEHVVQAGAEAVLLVRNPAGLSPQLAAKAQVATVDLTDAAAVSAACQGADALFWLVPPNAGAPSWEQWYHAVGAAGAAALRENNIPRAVLVSSLGAGMAPGLGTVSYIGDTERRFNETGASVVHLRPGYFMQNFLLQAERIRTEGVVSFPYADDHDIPFVSATDIAAVAARYLLRPDWAGQWPHNLMGPANLTLPECAALISEAWGHPVAYRRQSYAELRQELEQFGMPPQGQQELAMLFRALGDPHGAYATPRTPEAVTPTTFQEFVRTELLPRLQSAR
jgi:uncharacterized protein YbjT (DUF2867 family)